MTIQKPLPRKTFQFKTIKVIMTNYRTLKSSITLIVSLSLMMNYFSTELNIFKKMCYQSILKNPNNSKLAELCINIIDKKINSDWNVSPQTNDRAITCKTDIAAKANVISKQTLALLPKLVVIKPANFNL